MEQVTQDAIAILETLDEIQDGAPESLIYLALDSSLERWHRVRTLLTSSKCIKIKGYYVTITEAGRTMNHDLQTIIGTA